MLTNFKPAVLLASSDAALSLALKDTLESLGIPVTTASDGDQMLEQIVLLRAPAIVLVDAQLPGVSDGQLMIDIEETGIHRTCAIGLIADQATEEWIARLREGVIDDIIPRKAGEAEWRTHMNTMQRGHALFCELAHMRETAQIEDDHDRLTATFNRDTMVSILFRETDRVQRLQGALCLVLLKIDDFDHWTVELGAPLCDELLQQVAARVGRLLRSYDLLGRMGNDEFLLAMPGCSTVNAVMLAERVRMDVFGRPFVMNPNTIEERQVIVSGCFSVTSSGGRSPVVVLREAERTMADARLAGPDTIRCSSESGLSDAESDTPLLFPERAAMAR